MRNIPTHTIDGDRFLVGCTMTPVRVNDFSASHRPGRGYNSAL